MLLFRKFAYVLNERSLAHCFTLFTLSKHIHVKNTTELYYIRVCLSILVDAYYTSFKREL